MSNGPDNGQDMQAVVFSIDQQFFGIDISLVSEIIRQEEITPLPQASSYVEGIINLRGSVIPVLNLHLLFGMQADARDDSSRIIIVTAGDGQKYGLMVDAVQEVKKYYQEQLQETPGAVNVNQKYLKGIVLDQDKLIILVEPNQILSRGEMDQIFAGR